MSTSTPPPAPPWSTEATQPFRGEVPLHEFLQNEPSPPVGGAEYAVSLGAPRRAGVPDENYSGRQAGQARSRLYALTAFYMVYVILVLVLAFSTRHPWIAVGFFFVGCVIWTLVEYLFHRTVVHGRLPFGEGMTRRSLQEHALQPRDGNHISGELKDLLPLLFVAAPIGFLFPAYTAPVLLAGSVQGYVAEKWLHYAVRFSSSRFLLFRRLRKYNLYYRDREGVCLGYGIAARFWDVVFGTRFTETVSRSEGRTHE